MALAATEGTLLLFFMDADRFVWLKLPREAPTFGLAFWSRLPGRFRDRFRLPSSKALPVLSAKGSLLAVTSSASLLPSPVFLTVLTHFVYLLGTVGERGRALHPPIPISTLTATSLLCWST